MVRENRTKEYRFPEDAGDATTITNYSADSINGQLLRVVATANFTGSVILTESGTNVQFCNFSVASGTGLYQNQNFTVTTGSFATNTHLICSVGSLVSGTGVVYGPVSVLYR